MVLPHNTPHQFLITSSNVPSDPPVAFLSSQQAPSLASAWFARPKEQIHHLYWACCLSINSSAFLYPTSFNRSKFSMSLGTKDHGNNSVKVLNSKKAGVTIVEVSSRNAVMIEYGKDLTHLWSCSEGMGGNMFLIPPSTQDERRHFLEN